MTIANMSLLAAITMLAGCSTQFFFGRRVSFAIDGAPTPNGPGPYYAL